VTALMVMSVNRKCPQERDVECDDGWVPYTAVSIQNYSDDLALLITGKSQSSFRGL
jgi:hypothetical protein